jgi:hypothetical protein
MSQTGSTLDRQASHGHVLEIAGQLGSSVKATPLGRRNPGPPVRKN